MTSPWIEPRRPRRIQGPEALPGRADVIVIGGGLAGAAVALYLAEAGTDVVLLEARDALGAAASGRCPGHVTTGLIEHPYRVLHAMGPVAAGALYGFSRRSVALLAERGLLEVSGGWWTATDAREPDQIRASAEALRQLSVPVEEHGADEVNAALGTRGLGPGMRLPEDGFVDPQAAVLALAADAMDGGARCFVGSSVTGVTVDARGAVVTVGEREIVAEVVVFAANAWLPELEPWFQEKLTPVREQALCTEPLAVRLPVPGGRAGYGYTFWRQRPDGRLVAGGCRWATPHMEVGERDDAAVVPRIQDRIEAFVGKHLGVDLRGERAVAVTHRWSWIVAHSCDGLPIVGPLPGSPRLISCAGFGGNELGLGPAAARGVADGLLEGRVHDVPAFLSPSRLV